MYNNVPKKSEKGVGGRITLRVFRGTIIGMVSAVALVFSSEAVLAARPPSSSTPMRCLYEWEKNPNYVGDGWVGARVADVNGIFLGCGDERSGIIHIAHPESTGSIHPISASTQDEFLRCFELVATRGVRSADKDFPSSRTRVEFTYYLKTQLGSLPQFATIIYDNTGRFVWTFFTSSGSFSRQGNNWSGCTNILA